MVIFPLVPGAAESSSESNCPELPRLIVALVFFVLTAARPPLFAPLVVAEETFALDKVWALALAVLAEGVVGGSLNAGALASGWG